MMEHALQKVNLSPNEIKIFLTALQHGPAPASTLGKRCNLPRHTTYQTIETLKTRGLMGYALRNNIRYFGAVDPEILLERCETEIAYAKTTAQQIANMLMDVVKMRQTKEIPCTVLCMEGQEALKSVYDDILRERQSYLNFSYGLPLFECNPDAYRYFHNKRITYNMHVQKIMPSPHNPAHNPEKAQIKLLEVRYLPREKFPLNCDIRIYGNKIALIDNHKEIPNIVIVSNAALAKMFTMIFTLSWEAAEKYNL